MDKETGSLSLTDIEAGLERLMPRGLTDSAREDLESVVEDLASASAVAPFWRKSQVWQSAAAAVLITAVGVSIYVKRGQSTMDVPMLVQVEPSEEDSGIAIREQMTWIDSGADLGVQAVNDAGDVSRGWGYAGVEEERILHIKSGYTVILQRDFAAEVYSASTL